MLTFGSVERLHTVVFTPTGVLQRLYSATDSVCKQAFTTAGWYTRGRINRDRTVHIYGHKATSGFGYTDGTLPFSCAVITQRGSFKESLQAMPWFLFSLKWRLLFQNKMCNILMCQISGCFRTFRKLDFLGWSHRTKFTVSCWSVRFRVNLKHSISSSFFYWWKHF